MILLKNNSPIPECTYLELLMQDTKVNILKSCNTLRIKISKSLKKGQLAESLSSLFAEKPFYIINHLNKTEQKLLTKIIACKSDESVVVPISEYPLELQIHHLVVTKVIDGNWHLYMPDTIRQHIDNSATQDLSIYPGMQEWKDCLDEYNKLHAQIDADVRFNPMLLPIEQLPHFIQQLKDELSQLKQIENHLKRLEPQIKQYHIDFTSIYNSIKESQERCNTKLGLIQMFKWG